MAQRLSPWTHAILRIAAGLLFMEHGAQKWFGWFGGMGSPGVTAPLMSQIGRGGGARSRRRRAAGHRPFHATGRGRAPARNDRGVRAGSPAAGAMADSESGRAGALVCVDLLLPRCKRRGTAERGRNDPGARAADRRRAAQHARSPDPCAPVAGRLPLLAPLGRRDPDPSVLVILGMDLPHRLLAVRSSCACAMRPGSRSTLRVDMAPQTVSPKVKRYSARRPQQFQFSKRLSSHLGRKEKPSSRRPTRLRGQYVTPPPTVTPRAS